MPAEAQGRVTLLRDRSFPALLLLIAGYVIWRAQWMDVPFYWDEAWVYAPAVRAMLANGPSLLPDAIDVSLSRGHPLLFHFLAAVWATVFGGSATSLHVFALVVSVALLVSVYLIGRSWSDGLTALAMTALLLGHEGFLAQSGLLLPELMLALWTVLAWHCFLRRRWLAYFLFGSCALLTKEAGIVLILALAAWQVLLVACGEGDERKAHLRVLLISLTPLIPFAAHFTIQYILFGWVFFPEHVALLTPGLRDVAYKSRLIFLAVFEDQGRIVFTFAFSFLPLMFWKAGRPLQRIAAAVLYIAAIKSLWGRWPIPFIPEPLSSLLIMAALFFVFHFLYRRSDPTSPSAPAVAYLFVIAFWSFCALNFYTNRYLLTLHPIIIIGAGCLLWHSMQGLPRWTLSAVMWSCVIAQAWFIAAYDDVGDAHLSYLDAIAVEREMIAHLEQQGLHNAPILTDFTSMIYLTDMGAGYLGQGRPFTQVTTDPDAKATYAVVSNTSRTEIPSDGFTTTHRVSLGKAWIELRIRTAGGPER
ncbi:MAG: glycosyltransferase family 39 protein [Flavobacteriales bacterium]|nr:glycosyltransferase family 39 protein [Flavobacteriales bacterium]